MYLHKIIKCVYSKNSTKLRNVHDTYIAEGVLDFPSIFINNFYIEKIQEEKWTKNWASSSQ